MALGSPRKSGPGLYQPLAEINVTPMVDVMLVLLIVFMVTAPMLAAGMKVNLPQAAKSAGPMTAARSRHDHDFQGRRDLRQRRPDRKRAADRGGEGAARERERRPDPPARRP